MRRLFRRLWQEKDAIAAVEFAFVMPVMMTFFLGLVEAGQAMSARADVVNMASIGADLIAQESQVSSADMTNVYNALNAMLFPYPTTGTKITITSIVDNGVAGSGKVAWSCTQGGTARAKNSVYTLPNSSLITAGSGGSVILSEISYSYSSSISSYFASGVTWTNSFYSKPRNVAQITGPTTAC